jgi:ribose-phosphate pyrophosphokinase
MKTFPLLFSTETNSQLARQILGSGVVREGQAELSNFRDGEISFELSESVFGKDTIVLGSTFPPAENLIKLFTFINTLKIRGAASVTVIIPYLGYAKSDTEDSTKLPLNSKLFTEFIEVAGATRVITLDLHSHKNESYFHVPMKQLSAVTLAAMYFKKLKLSDIAVAAPDLGGVGCARKFAEQLGLGDVIIIEKTRPSSEQAEVIKVIGDPKEKKVIIIDDLIQTGGTLIAAAKAVKRLEANDVYVFVTHVAWAAGGVNALFESKLFKEIVVTDSIPKPEEIQPADFFTVLPIKELIVSAIRTT